MYQLIIHNSNRVIKYAGDINLDNALNFNHKMYRR